MVAREYDYWLLDLDGTLIDVDWSYPRSVFDRVGARLGRLDRVAGLQRQHRREKGHVHVVLYETRRALLGTISLDLKWVGHRPGRKSRNEKFRRWIVPDRKLH